MSVTREIGDSAERFKGYVDRLVALLRVHGIRDITSLINSFRRNAEFSTEWRKIWGEIAQMDGGKLSLTTLGVLLGNVLGGVGIAAAGSAIGLPLALVLGLGGLIAGSEFDAIRRLWQAKLMTLGVPKPIYERIKQASLAAGISPNDIVVQALAAAFPNPDELTASEPGGQRP